MANQLWNDLLSGFLTRRDVVPLKGLPDDTTASEREIKGAENE
jgi:hypothetical protein